MSDFDANRGTFSDAGENLRKAQEEIQNLVPLEGDRSRLVSLLNRVQDAFVELNEKLVKEDEKDKSTENDVRPGFERKDPNVRSPKNVR